MTPSLAKSNAPNETWSNNPWMHGARYRAGALPLFLMLTLSSAASALPSLDLHYLGGATGPGCVNSAPCVSALEDDIVRFAIVVNAEQTVAEYLSGYSFDLRWDGDGEDELDLVARRNRFSLEFVHQNECRRGPCPIHVDFNLGTLEPTQESSAGQEGHIYGFSASRIDPAPDASELAQSPTSVSFRVGYVSFRVKDQINTNPGSDIELGFFRAAGAFFSTESSNPTPEFGSFSVDGGTIVPEPRTALLLGAGLAALSALRRKSG